MVKLYFKNTRTGKRYEVVSMDKEARTVTLKGQHAEFVEKYDKERFERLGYILEKVTEEPANA